MQKNGNRIQTLFPWFLILPMLFAACSPSAAPTPQPLATRDPNEEKLLEKQLAAMNPEAVPVYQEATKQMDAGDTLKAVQGYQRVIQMAPLFSTAYRRLGYIELALEHLDKAEELSRKAVALEPNSYNQSALALVLVQKNNPKDSQEAYELATSSVQLLPDDGQANYALVLSAIATNHLDIATQANQHLLEVEPNHPVAHYFAGLFAAEDGKWEKAESELLYARDLGVDAAFIQQTLDKGISRNALLIRSIRRGAIATVAWLLGFGILFTTGSMLSRATMRALNTPVSVSTVQVKPQEKSIRSIYRAVIAVLSLYFYISIPFVILILLLVVGGAFYLFFTIGTIPVQIAVILVVMLLASLFAILRSLFTRIKDVPPGRSIHKADAPELWKLVEDVAKKLDTRPVQAIYVTPWTGISVYERGSLLQKLRGAGKRSLILGMGVLPGLTEGQLAAILAHEYGHFSNRDTAGGNLAYQVYTSLTHIAEGLIRSGTALVFNPVWLFVMGYQRVFLRVTLGASRLQEVLADRYAAMACGSQNFIDGLTGVIRQSISFPLRADAEIRKSLEMNQPISNLYDLPLESTLQGELQTQLDEAMNRPTSQYDSHPAPHERIAWIERMNVPHSSMLDNRHPALDLFPKAEELQREMTSNLLKNVIIQK